MVPCLLVSSNNSPKLFLTSLVLDVTIGNFFSRTLRIVQLVFILQQVEKFGDRNGIGKKTRTEIGIKIAIEVIEIGRLFVLRIFDFSSVELYFPSVKHLYSRGKFGNRKIPQNSKLRTNVVRAMPIAEQFSFPAEKQP